MKQYERISNSASFQDLARELRKLENDLDDVKKQGQTLVDGSTDPDGQKTMDTTLKVLDDRLQGVKALGEQKKKQLQVSYPLSTSCGLSPSFLAIFLTSKF